MLRWVHVLSVFMGFAGTEAVAVAGDPILYEVILTTPGQPATGTRVQASGAVEALGGRDQPEGVWRLLWTMPAPSVEGFQQAIAAAGIDALPERFDRPSDASHVDATATYRVAVGDSLRTIVVEGPLHHRIKALIGLHAAVNQTRPQHAISTKWTIDDGSGAPARTIDVVGDPMSTPPLKDVVLLMVRRPDTELAESERPTGAPWLEVHWLEEDSPVDVRSVWRDGSMRQRPAGATPRWGKMAPARLDALYAAVGHVDWLSLETAED